MSTLTLHKDWGFVVGSQEHRILNAALSGLAPHSCRVYTRHLTGFMTYLVSHNVTLSRESALAYLDSCKHDTSSYNQALSAIKRLATQAAENNWIDWITARTIDGLPSKKAFGTRVGNWLTLEQSRQLVNMPIADSHSARRDRAVLALLLGCGLRRDELSRLRRDQLQIRDGRTMIVDLIGKGNRVRTITVPEWCSTAITAWLEHSQVKEGCLVRSFNTRGAINGQLSTTAIWDIVTKYTKLLGIECSPHDLRRTYARLARKAGAPIEIIQHSLGHSSISTTERYMKTGEESNAGDYFEL
jgi:site-specific recombinase XerD